MSSVLIHEKSISTDEYTLLLNGAEALKGFTYRVVSQVRCRDDPSALEATMDTTTQAEPEAPVDDTEDTTPTAVEQADAEVEDDTADALSAEQEDDSDLVRKLRAESRKYRQRLREQEAVTGEAQTQRDHALATLESYERRDIERIAKEAGMLAPEDLWMVEQIQRFREDGQAVEEAAVLEVAAEMKKSRPHWFEEVDGSWPVAPQGPRGVPYSAPPSFGTALGRAGAGKARR